MTALTRLAAARPSVTILLALFIAIGGIYATSQTRTELTPEIELPVVTVITIYPGSGPEDVVDRVTRPIEQVVANVAGLDQQQSISAAGISVVVAQFEYGLDFAEVTRKIDDGIRQATLPEGAQAPRVAAVDVTSLPVVQLSLGGGDLDQAELTALARDRIVPELTKLEGVYSVELFGASDPEVVVEVDPEQAALKGIAVNQLVGALQANEFSLPAGTATSNGQAVPVRVVHRFAETSAIEDLIVGVAPAAQPAPGSSAQPGPQQPVPVRLGEIADVSVATSGSGGVSRTDGEPSIGLAIAKTEQAATVEVAHAVQARLDELLADLPAGLEVVPILDQSTFIDKSIDGLVREGLLGALFAVLVIFLFLAHVPTTLVAALSIPLSVLVALGALKVGDLTLNIITLGALAVAVGRVVDDSIVVLENIYRHVRIGGEPPAQAVITATREVASAITSSTLTTVAVFLPLGLVGGITGQLFLPFAITVTVALLASLIVAVTITPVLGRYLVGRAKPGEHRDGRLQRTYGRILRWSLGHRPAVLALAVASFVGAGVLVPAIPTAFLPAQADKFVLVNVAPDPGLSQERLLDATELIEEGLAADPEVTHYQTTLGAGGGLQTLRAAIGGRGQGAVTIYVRLVDDADLTAASNRLGSALGEKSPDVRVTVENPQASLTNRVQLTVSADDPAAAREGAALVLDGLAGVDGLFNLTSDASVDAPEITVEVDPERAALRGLSTVQVATALRTLMSGQEVAQVRVEDGRPMALIVRGSSDATATAARLRDLPLAVGPVPVRLGDIATVAEAPAPTQLSRVDGRPAVSISADVVEQDVGAVTARVDEVIDGLQLPAGVEVGSGGVAAQMRESFGGLGIALIAAIILVYLVMTITFGSLVDPFIILFSIPLAAVGALVALFVTGRPLGLSSLIGVLMLVGIVVTNAIVLLDFVEQARERGASVREALLEAGRIRVRPILMTALATILALIPLSLGLNEGAIIAAELGTVVIGGLISSTFLTLVVIPVIYSYVKRDRAPEPVPVGEVGPPQPTPAIGVAGAAAGAHPMFQDIASAYAALDAKASPTSGPPVLPIGRPRRPLRSPDERNERTIVLLLLGGLVALAAALRRALQPRRG